MKRKIFTLMLCALLGSALVNAQKPEGVFTKASEAPVIDGEIDAMWDDVPQYNVDKPFQSEVPTLGGTDETYFKAVWTLDGVYVLVVVADDDFFPGYEAGTNGWEADKVEVYFDVNATLVDGIGGGGGNGHYQFALDPSADFITGEQVVWDDGETFAYYVTDDASYVHEMFIPFTRLKDKDGAVVLTSAVVGFDVTVVDRDTGDSGRKRAVWANIGGSAESYANMDDCGLMTFEGADELIVATDLAITSTETAITTEAGTLQMEATILPGDATYNTPSWTLVNGTGKASITADGLVTGILNGTVTVKATTKDGTDLTDEVEITISNQFVSMSDINHIKDGGFDFGDGVMPIAGSPWGFWSGNAGTAEVIGGECVMMPAAVSDQWQLQVNQGKLGIQNDITYTLSFKAWADADRIFPIDIEDNGGHGNNRIGDSEDADAVNFTSEWQVAITTEPTVYSRTATIKRMDATSTPIVNMMPSADMTVVYVDDITLVSEYELSLLSTPAESITLQSYVPGTMTLSTDITTAGGQLQVSATVLPEGAMTNMQYSITAGGEFATIDAAGLVTGVANGTATIKGTDGNSGLSATLDITMTGQVGVKDNAANQFSYYPNPVNNVLNVEVASANSTIVIYNCLGSKIHSALVNGTSTTIDVSAFARGVYYIQVNDGAAKKFIK